jgi:hypothetical protein
MDKKTNTLFEILSSIVDHIYVLNMSNRPDRRDRILYQLKYIGYDDNNINHIKKLSFIYATPFPYNKLI